MDIQEERKDGFLVLCLEGRLDAVSSKVFEDKVLALIDGGETRLVIDPFPAQLRQQRGAQGLSACVQALESLRGQARSLLPAGVC
jgi:hypothetical protein